MTELIVVVGATGTQGQAVISTFLNEEQFRVRGITRHPTSEKADKLSRQGVEIVAADLSVEESLVKAFEGATVIFGVTDFWEHFKDHGPDHALKVEFELGINLARAAARTPTLKHYIFSSLPDTAGTKRDVPVVPHFHAKALVKDYIQRELKDALFPKTTFLYVGFYPSNFLYPPLMPNYIKSARKYAWMIPSAPSTPIGSVGDIRANLGLFVLRSVRRPELTQNGKCVVAVVEYYSMESYIKCWAEATGKETIYIQTSLEEYDRLWPMWGLEMGLMFKAWDTLQQDSWKFEAGHPGIVTAEDLDIRVGKDGVAGMGAALKAIDWSAIF